MKWKRKEVTDDEYVAAVRGRDRSYRKMFWVWPAIFVAFVFLLIKILVVVKQIGDMMPDTKEHETILTHWTGFAFGGVLGVLFGAVALKTGLLIKQWYRPEAGAGQNVFC